MRGEGGNQNDEFLFNGLPWNAEVPLHTMTYDTVQEWVIINNTEHLDGPPMDTHVWHQKILGTGTPCTDSCGLMI